MSFNANYYNQILGGHFKATQDILRQSQNGTLGGTVGSHNNNSNGSDQNSMMMMMFMTLIIQLFQSNVRTLPPGQPMFPQNPFPGFPGGGFPGTGWNDWNPGYYSPFPFPIDPNCDPSTPPIDSTPPRKAATDLIRQIISGDTDKSAVDTIKDALADKSISKAGLTDGLQYLLTRGRSTLTGQLVPIIRDLVQANVIEPEAVFTNKLISDLKPAARQTLADTIAQKGLFKDNKPVDEMTLFFGRQSKNTDPDSVRLRLFSLSTLNKGYTSNSGANKTYMKKLLELLGYKIPGRNTIRPIDADVTTINSQVASLSDKADLATLLDDAGLTNKVSLSAGDITLNRAELSEQDGALYPNNV